MTDSRERFEAWYSKVWNIEPGVSDGLFSIYADGRYVSEDMRNEEYAFKGGWEARDAEVAALTARLKVQDNPGQTHSEECWRWHRHHECAIGKVEALTARCEKLQKSLDEMVGGYADIESAVAARKAADLLYGFHENHGRRDERD